MTLFFGWQAIAALRGDGLRPEFLRLAEDQARRAADPRIVSLAGRAPEMPMQAGPCPASRRDHIVDDKVVHFERPAQAKKRLSARL